MPPWTDQELRTLIENRHLTAQQLVPLIPTRSVGAIGWALAGIDRHIQGRDVAAMLSHRGIEILEEELAS
jgi:hypothetical protein